MDYENLYHYLEQADQLFKAHLKKHLPFTILAWLLCGVIIGLAVVETRPWATGLQIVLAVVSAGVGVDGMQSLWPVLEKRHEFLQLKETIRGRMEGKAAAFEDSLTPEQRDLAAGNWDEPETTKGE